MVTVLFLVAVFWALDLTLRKCEMLLVAGWANQGAWWLTACCWITIYHQDRTV